MSLDCAVATQLVAVLAAQGNDTIPTMLDDKQVVRGWDVALLSILMLFALAAAPRAVARLSSAIEWRRGFMLFSGTPAYISPTTGRNVSRSQSTLKEKGKYSNKEGLSRKHSGYERQSGRGSYPPAHVSSWATKFYPISSFFIMGTKLGYTVGQMCLIFLYLLGSTIITFLYSNPVTGPNRTAWIAVSQIPVAVALATKNNITGLLTGTNYASLNYIHRWVGFTIALVSNIHTLSYIYKFILTNTLLDELKDKSVQWGLVAWIGVNIVWIFSSSFFRTHAHNLFYFSHVFGFSLFFFGVCYHDAPAAKYVIVAVLIYAVDYFFRVTKTRYTTALISAVPEMSSTLVEIPRLNSGWRAGQHVRIRVLSSGMGWLGWLEVHPFSIASGVRSKTQQGLVLICKKNGGWTNKLFELAKGGKGGVKGGEEGYSRRRVRVLIEGPYGGTGHFIFPSYSAAIVVVGGSGITFGLGVAEDLVQRICARSAATKFVRLVWVVQEKSALLPLLPAFTTLLESAPELHILVFYTQCSSDNNTTSTSSPLNNLPQNLSLHPGRPPLSTIFSDVIERTCGLKRPRGIAIGVCGPPGLVNDVHKIARDVDGPRRTSVGGVEVHEEVFGV